MTFMKLRQAFIHPPAAKDFFETTEAIEIAEILVKCDFSTALADLLNVRMPMEQIEDLDCSWPVVKYYVLSIAAHMAGKPG